MSMDIRYPRITGRSTEEKVTEVQSYLHQLVEQLNFALNNVSSGGVSQNYLAAAQNTAESQEDKAYATFNSIKALIIKSADIIEAYSEKLTAELSGDFLAISEFGEFQETTNNAIEANSTEIEQIYTNVQSIISSVENVESTVIEVNAHIKSGLLYYDEDTGEPVYGLEIGQRTEIDGEETFNKYARFTSEKLSFYDQNDTEVAYISDQMLYITHAEITGSFREGGFLDTVRSDGSVLTTWVGV